MTFFFLSRFYWPVAAFFGAGVSRAFAQGGGLQNPLRNINNFEQFVEALLRIVIDIGFPFLVLLIIYSGFLFVTAQGNEEKLKEAKKTFFWTIVGAAIFLGSWALAIVIGNTIGLITR